VSTQDNGGAAFPCYRQTDGNGEVLTYESEGMTLRDYFAAHAPPMPEQWFKDSPRKESDPLWHWGEANAAWSYFYADAALRARKTSVESVLPPT
jgi:hypothetical protein